MLGRMKMTLPPAADVAADLQELHAQEDPIVLVDGDEALIRLAVRPPAVGRGHASRVSLLTSLDTCTPNE